jgi:5'-nucleotidase
VPNILVTNDDGVHAPGILVLARTLETLGHVTILAPERNWSVSGHPKTLHKPLRLDSVVLEDGRCAYASNGAPSDCVALGVMGALDIEFDMVVSGINTTLNLGSDVLYSGTVAAAMEAIINDVPAIAVSTHAGAQNDADKRRLFQSGADIACRLGRQVLDRGLPPRILLNVNVPGVDPDQLQGIQFTRLGQRIYRDVLVKRDDPWGRPYFWIGGELPAGVSEDGSDIGAVEHDYVSVTPLGVDLTSYAFLDEMIHWNV